MKRFIAAATAATIAAAVPAAAQQLPLASGEYWEITAVDVEDGQGITYANWLASEWRRFNDFAKTQGWISDYDILANVHNREGEGDFYLVVKYKNLPDGAEQERRNVAFREKMQRSDSQLAQESGGRAKYRHVLGSMLLQEMNFRN
ncbi:hypothetical protein [Sphingomonas xanthus]|uniref:Uncharacterized protein n=1 Tax=Sphingomonas xanthus TaxID=2594473 RepID=A0A516IPN4_9SPHN|nr:hypothetical protein [Sphingomonas xanthus]QDP18898.1 hypothetical protein FMM02_02315 [Sphingomonas xanthus]